MVTCLIWKLSSVSDGVKLCMNPRPAPLPRYKKSPGHNENLEEVEKKVEAEKDEADWSAAALPLDEKQVDNAKKLRPDGLGNVWMNRTIDLIVAYERGDWVEAERLIQLQLAL